MADSSTMTQQEADPAQEAASRLVLDSMTERAAARTPDHVALLQDGEYVSYSALHSAVLRCVAALRARGVGPGDRVAYLGLNSIDYVILLQALLRIGGVLVMINWRLAAREIAYIIEDADVTLLVTDADRLAMVGGRVPLILLVDAVHDGRPRFREWIAGFEEDLEKRAPAPDDVAIQLYTSGTTGNPKGALLTHGSLSASLRQGSISGQAWAGWTERDVALVAMPQFHVGGTAWTIQALNAGGTAVLLAKPDIDQILDAVERHRITKMFAVPAVLGMMLDHPKAWSTDLSSLRTMLYGASPISPDILRGSMKLFPNAAFVQMYGSTETSGTIVYLPPEDHDVAGTPRMEGCGRPYPEVELKIVDLAGDALPPGKVGEVLVRSPLVMKGYHKLPEETARTMDGGWYRTGDAGHLDADGYLYLFDRVKDMIVSGAENVYPAEIERVLHEHPDVRDCAVIGVPDPRWGEAVKAVVVARAGSVLTAEQLIAFARDHIAGYKVPKSVDFVDELPRNPSGKVLKRVLRVAYWGDGGRQVQ